MKEHPLAPHDPYDSRRRGLSALDVLGILLIAGVLGFVWLQQTGREPLKQAESIVARALNTTEAAVIGAGVSEPEQPLVDPTILGDLGEAPAPRQRYPHIVPQSGESIPAAQHSFDFEGMTYTVSVDVDPQLYWGAVATENSLTTDASESHDELLAANYRYLVQDPLQAPLIAATCDSLRSAAKSAGLGRDRYAEFVAKYVQTMPYDYARLDQTNAKTRFPVETLVDGTGVCGDKSLLIAALLAHEGYDVALLTFESENHMAVGIKGPGKHYGESGRLFIESTTPAYVGEIPEHFVSGVTLTSDPLVIPIGTGKLQYEGAKRTARILKVRAAAHSAAENLRRKAEPRALTVGEAEAINAKLRTAYEAQFKLGAIKDHEDEFLDSKKAVAWIEKHCWWD